MAGAFPDDIIEIGAIRMPIASDKIEVFRRLIRPRTFINRTVRNMTGLTKEDLRDKSPLDVILPEFLDVVDPEALDVVAPGLRGGAGLVRAARMPAQGQ